MVVIFTGPVVTAHVYRAPMVSYLLDQFSLFTFTGQLLYSHLLNQLSHCSHLLASYGTHIFWTSCHFFTHLLATCGTHIYWTSCHTAHIYWPVMLLIFTGQVVTLLIFTSHLWYSYLMNQLSHGLYILASYAGHIYWTSCHIVHMYWPAMVLIYTETFVTLLTFTGQLWHSHFSYLLAMVLTFTLSVVTLHFLAS